jgi:transposase-like protein
MFRFNFPQAHRASNRPSRFVVNNTLTDSTARAGRMLSWRVDETHLGIRSKRGLPISCGDKAGQKVDFMLRARRRVAATKAFFSMAI